MIDQKVFAREWALICERWEREPSHGLSAYYYEILSDTMTTEEFVPAARRVFAHNVFFPAPADFFSYATRDDNGIIQWELCERLASGERGIWERMNDDGRRTATLMGGAKHLGMTAPDKLNWVRREFLALYREVTGAVDRRALTGPEVTPESRRIVGDVMRKVEP